MNGELRSIVLLLGACAITLIPNDFATAISGAISGLLTWKLLENLLHKPESRLDDVLAPMVWLVTVLWAKTTLTGAHIPQVESVVLAGLTVSLFIRWVQPILLPNDTIFLKRTMLTLTGGLGLLILFQKVLMRADLNQMAILGGAGVLLAYLLQSLDREVDDGPLLARALRNVLLVGIATLAASRFFGMQGLLVLAAASVVAPTPGSALIAGFFWLSRVLLQCYIYTYNTNVTGINLMHNFSTAALYAGFLVVLVAGLFIRDLKNRGHLSAILLASAIGGPVAINFFMHAEPTSSFLIALGVASVLSAFLAPAMYRSYASDQENVVLLPTLATVAAICSGPFLETGEAAQLQTKLVILASITGVILVAGTACKFLNAKKSSAPRIPGDAGA